MGSRWPNTEMLDLLQGRSIAAPDEETEAGEKKLEKPQRLQRKRQEKAPIRLDEADANISKEMATIRLDELDKNISKETVPIHVDKSDKTSEETAPILDRLDKSTPKVLAPICSEKSDERTDHIHMDESEANPSETKWDGSISAGSRVDGGDPLTDPSFTDVGDNRSMKSCSSFCRDDISIKSGISCFTEKSSRTCQPIQLERMLMHAFHLQLLNPFLLLQVSFLRILWCMSDVTKRA